MIINNDNYDGMSNKLTNEYDYLEIGTCDWDVFSITKPHLKGIAVEPIKIYLDNIPYNKNVIKINMAISNEDKDGEMYYPIISFNPTSRISAGGISKALAEL